VEGIYRLMLSSENEPVNIGNPQEMTVKEMAQLIVELTGSKSRIVYRDLPEDDPKVRQPDITRAKAVLGWEPRVPVREGLQKTVEWFLANHRATTEATT
jgi:dTDP-glucose 4,6-dehydratase